MYITTTINATQDRIITLTSSHSRSNSRSKPLTDDLRNDSVLGTKSYTDSLRRAFTLATTRIYFNPDMQYFLTFTYKQKDNTIEQVQKDIKTFIKKQNRYLSQSVPENNKNTKLTQNLNETNKIVGRAGRGGVSIPKTQNPLTGHTYGNNGSKQATDSGGVSPKYIYVMEYQKRGSIHVHMIANNFFRTNINKNGYLELSDWKKGYSSIMTIADFDTNFKPYLYLFKYMKKSQRIGKSFVHSSRNLDNYKDIDYDTIDLNEWRLVLDETKNITIPTTGNELLFKREYYERIILPPTSVTA